MNKEDVFDYIDNLEKYKKLIEDFKCFFNKKSILNEKIEAQSLLDCILKFERDNLK